MDNLDGYMQNNRVLAVGGSFMAPYSLLESDRYEALKLENQLCFPLYAAARNITGLYTPLLKPLGLTYTQYIAFLSLWEEGEETVGDMCRSLHLDCGTLTPMLKKMEENGWITRSRSREDERVVTVALTQQG